MGPNSHLPAPPLHLLDDVEAAVYDELVHVPGLLAEARLAVAALLRRPELVLEERVVLRADDGEVVRHLPVFRFDSLSVDHLRRWACFCRFYRTVEFGRGELYNVHGY